MGLSKYCWWVYKWCIVSTQKYRKLSLMACSPQNLIFSNPALSQPESSAISSKVTSWLSSPHVWERMAYGGIASSAVALRSRMMLSSRSHSFLCFASTRTLKGATCFYLTSLQEREREGMILRRIYGNKLFGKVDGSLEAGLFWSSLLLVRLNSLLERANELAINSLSSSKSTK